MADERAAETDAERARRALIEVLRAERDSMAHFDWIGHPDFEPLVRELETYDRHTTVATIAGLLTVPGYQTACLRLELLLHLAACHCRGTRRITKRALSRWVNETLAALPIRRMEDPIEDVFISNVVAGGGNCRIFEGTWEGNDFHLQLLLDVLYLDPEWRRDWKLRARVEGLLTLSEAVAARAGLPRWATTVDEFPRSDVLRRIPELETLWRRVTFTESDLRHFDVLPVQIASFLAQPSEAAELSSQAVRNSLFLRRPVARFDREFVVVLPSAISMAVRHAILDAAAESGRLDALQRAFDSHQSNLLFGTVMSRLDLPSGYRPPNAVTPEAGTRAPRRVASVAFVPFDVDKIAHVVLLTDDLAGVHRTGVASDAEFGEGAEREIAEYLLAGTKLIREAGATGMTLIVIGGLGRTVALSVPCGDDGLPADWPTVSFSLGDLQTFAATEDASLLRLWKLDAQEAAARGAGIRVANPNGALNLYAFWRHQGFQLVGAEMPVPQAHGFMMIQADFLYHLRATTRQLIDIHALPLGTSAAQLRVRRLHERPFFPSASHRPIYVADDLLAAGELAGAVESDRLIIWVFASRASAPAARETLYRTWNAILSWLDRLAPSLEDLVNHRSAGVADKQQRIVRRFRLVLDDEDGWASDSIPATPKAAARPWVTQASAETDDEAVIHLPAGFQTLLNQSANVGERALLEEVVLEIVSSSVAAPSADTRAHREALRPSVVPAVAACMGGADAREMHVWHTTRPLDLIDATALAAPRFVQPEDEAAWQFGLGARLGVTAAHGERSANENPEAAGGVAVLEGTSDSISFLHRLVDHIWEELRARLQIIDGPSLVAMLTSNVESIFKDRDQWRRTARAVSAIHADEDVPAVSMQRESERAVASTAARAVIEMGLCTSPLSGGRNASLADIDWLVAGTALLLEAAADADAIRGGLAAPRVVVAANGTVRTERDELQQLIYHYGRDTHADEFRAAADAYDELFRRDTEQEAAAADDANGRELAPKWDDRFRRAYHAEFGISFDRVVDAFAELIDLAGVHGRVVVTTRGEVSQRLRANRGFSSPEVDALLAAVALEPRPRWDDTPPGFTRRDWEPWRFRRRLSVSARPVIMFGRSADARCIYGAAQLGASLSYVPEGIRSGWFPTEYFRSAEMRRYRGAVAEELGADFEREISQMCADGGWTTRRALQMPTLGAPARLGDVDVVAWRHGHPVLWLIECKRLQPTRTISEIVERLRQFRGESDDLLAKHLRRLEWVRSHFAEVRTRLGIPDDVVQVDAALVTSARMPMQYATTLPLPPGNIVSREELLSTLERRQA